MYLQYFGIPYISPKKLILFAPITLISSRNGHIIIFPQTVFCSADFIKGGFKFLSPDLDFLGLTDLLEGRIPDNAPSPAAARTEKRPSFQIPTKDNTHSTKDNTKDQGKDYTQDNRPGKECLCAMNRALQNPKGRAEPTRGPCYYELKRKGCFEAKRENCCTQCNCCAKSKTRYPCDPPPLPATKTTFIQPDRPDPSPAVAISAPSLEYTGVSEEDCCLPECVLCSETPCNFHDQMACEIFAKYCITDLKLPDTYEE